jgi:hypothetical protein
MTYSLTGKAGDAHIPQEHSMSDPRYELRIEKFMTLPPQPGCVVVLKDGQPCAFFDIERIVAVLNEWNAMLVALGRPVISVGDPATLTAKVAELEATLASIRNTCKHEAFYKWIRGVTVSIAFDCPDCGAPMSFTPFRGPPPDADGPVEITDNGRIVVTPPADGGEKS